MKSLISLIAGAVVGIAGTVFTFNSVIQTEQQASITTPDPTPVKKPETLSPFAPVSRTSDPAAKPTKITSNDNTITTAALSITDIADIKHYRELRSALQSLDNTDSDELKSLLTALPVNLYQNAYANTLNTAIYQRWAESDIDAALLHVVEIFESNGRRQSGDPMQAVSILASTNPGYVSEWIENYASQNPALLHAAYSGIASIDPEAFIKNFIANSNSDDPMQEDQFGGLHSALMQWGEQDPRAAITFLNSEAQLTDLPGMRENLLYMWFEKDPDAAMAEIEALLNDPTSSPETNMMLTDLYIGHLAETDPNSALQWALAQDNPMQRENALMNIIFTWDENTPGSLLSFIDQLPPAERDSILPMAAPQIANNMARNDPAGAIAWAQQLPQDSRQGAIMSVIDQWVYTDPASAMSWIRSQPDTPQNQNYLMNAAGSMLHRDPAMASEIFATLPESLQNNMAEQMIFMQMEQNPGDARDWVSQQTNPTVQEIGFIVLDSRNPDIDAISILDRVAALQTDSRKTLLMTAISERASTDIESVQQWITESPLLTDDERAMLTDMTGGFSSRFGLPFRPYSGAGDYYLRR